MKKKKIQQKPIPKAQPKKREDNLSSPIEVNSEPKSKQKQVQEKYIKIAGDAPQVEFKAIGERIQTHELRWGYYAFDTTKGYHHYLILPK